MMEFIKDNGEKLRIIKGFRERALTYRTSQTPRDSWIEKDYDRAVRKRLKRHKRLIKTIKTLGGNPSAAEVLEVGCGDGINTLLMGLYGAKHVTGIDIDLRLFNRDEKGEVIRRLADGTIRETDNSETLDSVLANPSIEFLPMDATRMNFSDNSFDIVISRSVLEHIFPIERLYSEINRVIRPGGFIYHEIDPFYWLRGCHKRGLVDIPWAHARLNPKEYHRFVTEYEGKRTADKRLKRIMTLNHLTIAQWKKLHDDSLYEIISWKETISSFAEEILKENPEIPSTLLPGVCENDLIVSRIRVSLRKTIDKK
jgi:SAM-dependent methyltransferase